uniref:LPS-assembly protein LptD n=1 Tax=Yoonia sp. TaxID=2212373 RepID=UPI0040486433
MRFLLAFLLILPSLTRAQGIATLVADSVVVAGDAQLIADGNIDVFYDGTRLSATQITYDRSSDRLMITGPIVITTADGTVLTASQASLDPKLENGILRGARLVLDQQLQLAATQIDRAEGRYSQLYKVAVTSCKVCGRQSPLWEIRAQSVVHDAQARQLYFTNTQFLIRGVPVFWLPKMRLPDPTQTRATGLLIPSLRTTDQLGTGIKLPYFITLGDSRDLKLTPYLSPRTTTLETRYRQAFATGDIEINTAVSRDTLVDANRSYVFAAGEFDVGAGYTLSFAAQTVSDDSYLLDYGYSEQDRLESAVTLERIGENRLNTANLTYYQTLRDDEVNASLPPVVGSFRLEQQRYPASGGTLRFAVSGDTLYRTDDSLGVAGRDMSRLGAELDWTRDWIGASGLVVSANAGLRGDLYAIQDGALDDEDGLRGVPQLGITLRYPLAGTSASGAQNLVEPTLALLWSDSYGITPPNEDSTRSELDQTNLLSATHFAGDDAVETGLRAAAGVTWTRLGAGGAQSTVTFGRILRSTDSGDFNPSSGLDGTSSDWLLAGQYISRDGFRFDGRTLFDDDASITRAATWIGWDTDWLALNAAYIWQAADTTESRPDAVSEWTLDTDVKLSPTWSVSVDTRYDLASDEPARAGLGVVYHNECVTVDLSVSRRYTSSDTVDPSTSFGVSVTLNGFSAAQSSAAPKASCSP